MFIRYHKKFYIRQSTKLSKKLRRTYDAKLKGYDVPLMLTLPITVKPIPDDLTTADDINFYIQRTFEMLSNTAPFDKTEHPAMKIPWGKIKMDYL